MYVAINSLGLHILTHFPGEQVRRYPKSELDFPQHSCRPCIKPYVSGSSEHHLRPTRALYCVCPSSCSPVFFSSKCWLLLMILLATALFFLLQLHVASPSMAIPSRAKSTMAVDWRAGATNSTRCMRRDTSSGMSKYCKQQVANFIRRQVWYGWNLYKVITNKNL